MIFNTDRVLTELYTMKTQGETGVQCCTFLTSTLDEGEWSTTTLAILSPYESLNRKYGGLQTQGDSLPKSQFEPQFLYHI